MGPDDLYGLPLDRFVAERGALARALRADGRRDDAADVASLRKPSIAAWAVNQLVRTRGRDVQALFDAGDELRGAQSDLLAGSGDGGTLRTAGERERAGVDGLVDAARGLLTSDGYELSSAVIERVADTLHAAALDEDARELVREGRLERELRHAGLGLGEGAPPAPPATKGQKSAPRGRAPARPAKVTREPRRREAQERAEAERAERERAATRKAARAAEAKARRRVDAATRAVEAAEQQRERAAEALREADAALAAAREDAATAAAELRRARAELDDS